MFRQTIKKWFINEHDRSSDFKSFVLKKQQFFSFLWMIWVEIVNLFFWMTLSYIKFLSFSKILFVTKLDAHPYLYLLSRYSDEPWSESLSNWFWENLSCPLIGGNIVCLELTCLIGCSRSHGNIGMSLLAEFTAISDVLVISGLQIVNGINQS